MSVLNVDWHSRTVPVLLILNCFYDILITFQKYHVPLTCIIEEVDALQRQKVLMEHHSWWTSIICCIIAAWKNADKGIILFCSFSLVDVVDWVCDLYYYTILLCIMRMDRFPEDWEATEFSRQPQFKFVVNGPAWAQATLYPKRFCLPWVCQQIEREAPLVMSKPTFTS